MTRRLEELEEWIERVSAPGWHWYVKYVAANDTYAKPNVHQGGPYVGKDLFGLLFRNSRGARIGSRTRICTSLSS